MFSGFYFLSIFLLIFLLFLASFLVCLFACGHRPSHTYTMWAKQRNYTFEQTDAVYTWSAYGEARHRCSVQLLSESSYCRKWWSSTFEWHAQNCDSFLFLIGCCIRANGINEAIIALLNYSSKSGKGNKNLPAGMYKTNKLLFEQSVFVCVCGTDIVRGNSVTWKQNKM